IAADALTLLPDHEGSERGKLDRFAAHDAGTDLIEDQLDQVGRLRTRQPYLLVHSLAQIRPRHRFAAHGLNAPRCRFAKILVFQSNGIESVLPWPRRINHVAARCAPASFRAARPPAVSSAPALPSHSHSSSRNSASTPTPPLLGGRASLP